jgi:hypothetical protein
MENLGKWRQHREYTGTKIIGEESAILSMPESTFTYCSLGTETELDSKDHRKRWSSPKLDILTISHHLERQEGPKVLHVAVVH